MIQGLEASSEGSGRGEIGSVSEGVIERELDLGIGRDGGRIGIG